MLMAKDVKVCTPGSGALQDPEICQIVERSTRTAHGLDAGEPLCFAAANGCIQP